MNTSTQSDDQAIRADGIVKSFGDKRVLDGLSLRLRRGEIMGFLGTNGAGKTTTVKILLGFLKPDSGTVEIFGGAPDTEATRARIGFMPEIAYYYPYLNVRELLAFYGGICGMDKQTVKTRTDESGSERSRDATSSTLKPMPRPSSTTTCGRSTISRNSTTDASWQVRTIRASPSSTPTPLPKPTSTFLAKRRA